VKINFYDDQGSLAKTIGPFDEISLAGGGVTADGFEVAFFDRDSGDWWLDSSNESVMYSDIEIVK
jgi:hypothetical protein